MRAYPLVVCGHRGAGVLSGLVPLCPFREEPVCDACFSEVMRFVAHLQARGHDPLPKPKSHNRSTHPRLL